MTQLSRFYALNFLSQLLHGQFSLLSEEFSHNAGFDTSVCGLTRISAGHHNNEISNNEGSSSPAQVAHTWACCGEYGVF